MSKGQPSNTLRQASKPNTSWRRIEGKDWSLTLCVLSFFFSVVFSALEIYNTLKNFLFKKNKSSPISIRSIGERTLVSRTNSLQRKDSSEVLRSWLSEDKVSKDGFNTKYTYSNFSDLIESVVVATTFVGHARHVARLVLNDKDPVTTAAKLVETVKKIKQRARKSVKFQFLFRELIHFLEDIENSRSSSITTFVRMLACEMRDRPATWYLDFIHSRCRAAETPPHVYETALATLALFFREGAGFEAYALRGGWQNPDRLQLGLLTLLMYCTVEQCIATTPNEINVTEFSGVDRILVSRESNHKFQRFISLTTTKSDKLFKDKMMWDITLNCCNEFIESSWSPEALERTVWGLQHCRETMYKEVYHQLEDLNGKRNLGLTHLSPLILMTFSVSGMIHFHGTNDCVYVASGDPNAKVRLHGNLPLPTVQDLISLDIIRRVRNAMFEVKPLPGSEKKFKGVKIGDRIKFIESRTSEPFSAKLTHAVG